MGGMSSFPDLVREILEEHKVIVALLTPLERAAATLGADAEAPRLLEHVLRFLEYFAEEYHHNREEGEFFGALRANGLLQIADMLQQDHRNGMKQIQALQRELPAASRGDPEAIAFLRAEGSHYVALTREHMRQENDILQVLVADEAKKKPAVSLMAEAPQRFDRSAGGRDR